MRDLQKVMDGINSINENGGVFYIYGYQNRITFNLVKRAITKLNIQNVVHLYPSAKTTFCTYPQINILDGLFRENEASQDIPLVFSPKPEVSGASLIIVTNASFVEKSVAIRLLQTMKPLIIIDDPSTRINELDGFAQLSGYGYLTNNTPNFFQFKKTSRIADFAIWAARCITFKSGDAA
ncbi:MAG: hypothetical protein AXW12_00495 [Thalassospira sp. Nap_22]|nr:MAG: hypothetical protein AXW12_00495 [Thalassospira sp. Nap_22]